MSEQAVDHGAVPPAVVESTEARVILALDSELSQQLRNIVDAARAVGRVLVSEQIAEPIVIERRGSVQTRLLGDLVMVRFVSSDESSAVRCWFDADWQLHAGPQHDPGNYLKLPTSQPIIAQTGGEICRAFPQQTKLHFSGESEQYHMLQPLNDEQREQLVDEVASTVIISGRTICRIDR